MPEVLADRKASYAEVHAHASAMRGLAVEHGLPPLLIRDDGAVVIHSTESGYRAATRFAIDASKVVGAYVHVITDEVPGAATAVKL